MQLLREAEPKKKQKPDYYSPKDRLLPMSLHNNNHSLIIKKKKVIPQTHQHQSQLSLLSPDTRNNQLKSHDYRDD
jgi:hypothetical protein